MTAQVALMIEICIRERVLMPSFEAKLYALMQEVARNREVQDAEMKERQLDHDRVVEQGRDLKTAFTKLGEFERKSEEKNRRGWELWLAVVSGLIALVVSIGSAVMMVKYSERPPAVAPVQTNGGK
jgi:hypothetical protein